MRIGQNPAKLKGSPAYAPTPVGLATLTYVPALEGYFREAREVIRAHLASLRASLSQDCDLYVFDNGSCPEVLAFLQDQWQAGEIDGLFLSHHNLGKNGILNWIFGALPNEYIAYSDSDVFFRKGWLEASLAIFEAFPRAGMVSAQPVFFDFLKGQGQTAGQIARYGEGLSIETVQPRPDILEEYCNGINATEDQRVQFRAQELPVAIHAIAGARAVTRATDMQFMLSREAARQILPIPIAGALTGKDAIEIPRKIEELGYWILSTEEPLVWHMGNMILERELPEILALETSGPADITPGPDGRGKPTAKGRFKAGLRGMVRRSTGLKRAVERVYSGLFSILYEE